MEARSVAAGGGLGVGRGEDRGAAGSTPPIWVRVDWGMDDAMVVVWLLVVAVGGCGLAWLLRRSGTPGGVRAAGMIGGVAAGVVLGQSVAGRAWPGVAGAVFDGAAAERTALVEFDREQDRRRAALEAAGVSRVAVEELAEEVAHDRRELAEAVEAARLARRAEVLATGGWLGVLGVGCAAVVATSRRTELRDRVRRGCRDRTEWGAAIGAIVAWGAASVVVQIAMGCAWGASLAIGAAFAAPGVAAFARGRPAVGAALAWGAMAACVSAVAASWWVLAAAGAGVVASSLASSRVARRGCAWLATNGAMPAACAVMVAAWDVRGLDPGSAWGWVWLLVLALVVSSDVRWGAGWVGQKLVGTARAVRVSSRPMDAGAGVSQVLMIAVVAGAGMAGVEIVCAAVAGAIVVEGSRGLRRGVIELIEGA